MFTANYFAPRYFAPRYFPEVGATAIASGYLFFFTSDGMDDMIISLTPKAVTPSDVLATNALLADGSQPDRVWVGTTGDVTVVLPDGTTFAYPSAAAGGWHDMPFFKGVKATGTTATGIKVTRKRRLQ